MRLQKFQGDDRQEGNRSKIHGCEGKRRVKNTLLRREAVDDRVLVALTQPEHDREEVMVMRVSY